MCIITFAPHFLHLMESVSRLCFLPFICGSFYRPCGTWFEYLRTWSCPLLPVVVAVGETFKNFEVYALLKEISCGQCDWQPCIFVQCATPGFVGQMQSTLQDVVCWYCSRPAMHCEKNEFSPPPPDELGNFPSQFFKKWTCRNLVTTLLALFPTGFFFRIYVINWQQSFTFIISNAYIVKQMDVCCSTFSF